MPQAQIQSDLNAIATQQVPVGSQFDSQRYAIFFEPAAVFDPRLRAAGGRHVRRRLRQQRKDVGGFAGDPDPPGHHQRRVVFQDYCGAQNDFASGGFIADSQISGDLNFYGNQLTSYP